MPLIRLMESTEMENEHELLLVLDEIQANITQMFSRTNTVKER